MIPYIPYTTWSERDPERIDEVLAAVAEHWKAMPDLRLGQIIGNCANLAGIDPYAIEDDVLLKILTAWR